MLAFDIETTGLNPRKSVVTVVCTEDFFTGKRKAYEFARIQAERDHLLAERDKHAVNSSAWLELDVSVSAQDDLYDQTTRELIEDLDAAPALCAFNGIQFDIPFLQTAFDIDTLTVAHWVLKTTDILEVSRIVYKNTFKLDLLCQYNNMTMKSGSGLEAIRMAEEGRFDDLREYCADDVHILNNLYRQQYLKHPRTDALMNLGDWAPSMLYEKIKD